MKGLKTWKNPKNRFTVIELHYTADPAKRDPLWKKVTSAGMPRQDWAREYELSWETYAGKPVWPDFSKRLHVAEYELQPAVGLPIIRGWDSSGLHPAVVFLQIVGRRVNVLHEIVENNVAAINFVPRIKEFSARNFGTYKFFDYCDPAGKHRSVSDLHSYYDIMRTNGIIPQDGEEGEDSRVNSVARLLATLWEKLPLLQISPACPILIQAMSGGYHRNEVNGKIVKNMFADVADALQYPISKLDAIMHRSVSKSMSRIARPVYGN